MAIRVVRFAPLQSVSSSVTQITGGVLAVNLSTGSLTITAGDGISFNTAASHITIQATGATSITSNLPGRLSYTQNFPLSQAAVVSIGTLTATGTTAANNPFGSSLSLQRLFVPALMSMTEIDMAFGISFPATSDGQGSLSQTAVFYKFGNSTSLSSYTSASRAVSWTVGTAVNGVASTRQQGWASNNIQPFTFSPISLSGGEYAVGHLLSWAAQSTSWTISVWGAAGNVNSTASAVTNVSSATLSAASTFATGSSALTAFTSAPVPAGVLTSGGLSAGSFHTGTTSTAATVFTASPTAVNVLSSSALAAGSGVTGISSYGAGIIPVSLSAPMVGGTISITSGASFAGSTGNAAASLSGTGSASQASFNVVLDTANSRLVSALGTVAGSIFTASASGAVISNAGTAAVPILSTGGLLAGSFFTATGSSAVIANSKTAGVSLALSMTTASIGALTAVGTQTGSLSFGSFAVPSFRYNGTMDLTASYVSGELLAGVMSTGANPASIDLRSTVVTVTGSLALAQPWFALIGS